MKKGLFFLFCTLCAMAQQWVSSATVVQNSDGTYSVTSKSSDLYVVRVTKMPVLVDDGTIEKMGQLLEVSSDLVRSALEDLDDILLPVPIFLTKDQAQSKEHEFAKIGCEVKMQEVAITLQADTQEEAERYQGLLSTFLGRGALMGSGIEFTMQLQEKSE